MTIVTPLNGHIPPALVETLDRLERRFGHGARVYPASETLDRSRVTPTGWPALDMALGIGGLPAGRIVDVFGPEGSGKTTLALRVIAETQRQGGTAVFIDTENGFDLTYALAWGIDPARLLIAQPATAEEALTIVMALVQASIETVVLDSVAGLIPYAEVEGGIGLDYGGLLAGLLSQSWRKLVGPLHKNDTLLLVTNQLRTTSTGETVTGGMALRHYASVRLDLRPGHILKRGEVVIGRRIRATVRKNRLAPPFRTAEFDLFHGGER